MTDASQKDHQDTFYYSFYGTELTYAYNTYRFHGKDTEELKKSDNPFALAVLAGIYISNNKGREAEDHEKGFATSNSLSAWHLKNIRTTQITSSHYCISLII